MLHHNVFTNGGADNEGALRPLAAWLWIPDHPADSGKMITVVKSGRGG